MNLKKLSGAMMALVLAGAFPVNSNAQENVVRYSGNDRYQTSIETAGLVDSDTVVFANGRKFHDSLSSVNIVNANNAKLVLVKGTEDMSGYVKENGIKKVYIVGGESSITSAFQSSLEKVANVKRISGNDRYDTNKETLKTAEYEAVGVASGDNYPDALSATRLLKEKSLGLLLANPSNAENAVKGYDVKYVFGGKNSLPLNEGTRIAGENRFETSLAVEKITDAKDVVIVSGKQFADALSAVNVSTAKQADILVAPSKSQKDFSGIGKDEKEIYAVGGIKTLSDADIKNTIDGITEETASKDNTTVTAGNYRIEKTDGKAYIYDADGNKVDYSKTDNGIIKIDNKAYMISKEDNSVYDGFFKIGNDSYYSTLEYGLRRGWKYIDKDLYYFSPSTYKMYRGGIKSTGNNAYWFGDDGKLRTGSRPGGHRGKRITWYGPSKEELSNSWLNVADAEKKFKGQEIVNFATQFDGLPFRWFGSDLRDKRGVYCCGAAYSAMKEFGIKIPGPDDCNPKADNGYRMVKVQYLEANKFGGRYVPTNWNTMWPGDISYSSDGPGHYSHAALYMGKNGGRPIVIHATLADGFIAEPASIITNGWHYRYLNAVRYL